jgi:hypothetical protein
MDRRTKIILLSIGSVLLLAAILWFVVWPLLKPVLPSSIVQPPKRQNNPPVVNVPGNPTNAAGTATSTGPGEFTYQTYEANPDIATINDMKRRAGILAERAESGSNADGFTNYADAALNVTPKLAKALAAKAADMQKAHSKAGPAYFTIARRLVEIPENTMKINGNGFKVRVQMQVDIRDNGKQSTEWREATVSFVLVGAQWLPDTYDVKPFSP